MKLKFQWKNDGQYHQYCLLCHAEKVEAICKDGKTYYLCRECGKISERSIIIDPAIKWWVDEKGEYWHESAGVFVRNKQKNFLFFERTIYPFSYTVPSGHVDSGEEPLQAAMRELEEEVGIKAKNLLKISTENIVGDSCRRGSDAHRWHAYLYLLEEIDDMEIKVCAEGKNPVWLSIDQALQKELTFPVSHIINKYKNELLSI
ncbi:MAG: NUDIX hydrolase [Patescibacteria group bacterium]|nr:NUDIX hydrolase [Patescibacteria group bacterium]